MQANPATSPDREDVAQLALMVMQLTDRMSRYRAERIDRTAMGVLRIAATRASIRPTEIAEQLQVHPSSVTRHVQALAKTGRLRTRPDPADGRASLVEVTETGLADLWQLYEQGVDAWQRAVAGWLPDEVRALAAGLGRLVAALDARAKEPSSSERRERQ